MEWVVHVARMEEMKNASKVLVENPEGRLKNIRMDLRERGWKCVDRLHVAQDRDRWWAVSNTVMKL